MNETVERYVVAGRRLLSTLTGVGAVACSAAMHTEVMVLARRARELGLTELAGRWTRLSELLPVRGRLLGDAGPEPSPQPSLALAHAALDCHDELEALASALTAWRLEAQLSRASSPQTPYGFPGDERRW